MSISTSITVSDALNQLSKLSFPQVEVGDHIWYPGGNLGQDVGHRFRWNGVEWISDPTDMPV